MSASKLEIAVERFNAALVALKTSAEQVKRAQPLTEHERSAAVARIDQAIGALQKVLGKGESDASGQR